MLAVKCRNSHVIFFDTHNAAEYARVIPWGTDGKSFAIRWPRDGGGFCDHWNGETFANLGDALRYVRDTFKHENNTP